VRQPSGDTLAFVLDRGNFVLLNSLLQEGSGWNLTRAVGINNRGTIVGVGYYNGNLKAFSLVRTPRSTALALKTWAASG